MKKYGHWVVISKVGKLKILCRCICGKEKIVYKNNIFSGKSKSCGCKKRENRFINLEGKTIGKWKVIKRVKNKNSRIYWLCRCSCGKEKEVCSKTLINGGSKSCGHDRKPTKTHGMTRTRFYSIFSNIKSRCNNKKTKSYVGYGSRGIKNEWLSFENFRDDMYESYLEHVKEFGEKQTTIERINVNGNYCKENCTWATQKEQANNKTNKRIIVYKNKKYTIKELSNLTGFSYSIILHRLHRNWNIEKIVNQLPKKYN